MWSYYSFFRLVIWSWKHPRARRKKEEILASRCGEQERCSGHLKTVTSLRNNPDVPGLTHLHYYVTSAEFGEKDIAGRQSQCTRRTPAASSATQSLSTRCAADTKVRCREWLRWWPCPHLPGWIWAPTLTPQLPGSSRTHARVPTGELVKKML